MVRVAWGPWADEDTTQDVSRDPVQDTVVGDGGLFPMRPEQALRALDRAARAQETGTAVFDADWKRLAAHVATTPGARPVARMFDGIPVFRDALRGVGALHEEPSTEDPDTFLRRLDTLPAQERRAEMLRLVRAQAALVLGHDNDEVVAPDRGFVDMGFDSLTATRLRNRLGAATGLQISAATVLDCPTPGTLADHLLELCKAPRTRARPRLRPRDRE